MPTANILNRKPRTLLGHLRAERDVLVDPKRWTQRCCARTKAGVQISYESPKAYSFCQVGIRERLGGCQLAGKLVDKVATTMGYRHAIDLNDDGTHDELMEMYSIAIAHARGAGI